jgi:hypothetical protein
MPFEYGVNWKTVAKDAVITGAILGLAGQLPAPGLAIEENARRVGLLFFGTLVTFALHSILYK